MSLLLVLMFSMWNHHSPLRSQQVLKIKLVWNGLSKIIARELALGRYCIAALPLMTAATNKRWKEVLRLQWLNISIIIID